MKKKILRAVSLAVIAVFLFGSSLYAEHGCKPGEGKFDKLTEELGLSPEQKTQLDAQREAFKSKNEAAWEKLKAKKEELRAELEKPTVDRAKVSAIIEDMKNLEGEKLNNRVDKILAMKSILTPEQFTKLQDKMQKKRKEFKKRMKHGPGMKRQPHKEYD